jgi:hypothetical protein
MRPRTCFEGFGIKALPADVQKQFGIVDNRRIRISRCSCAAPTMTTIGILDADQIVSR